MIDTKTQFTKPV